MKLQLLRKALRICNLNINLESEVEIVDMFENEIVILYHKQRTYSGDALKVRGIVVDLVNERVILKSLPAIKKVTADILQYTEDKLFLNTLEFKDYTLDVSILNIIKYIDGFFIRTFLQNDVMFIVSKKSFISVSKKSFISVESIDRSLLYPDLSNSPISYKFYIIENSFIRASKVPILEETKIIPFGESYLWDYNNIPKFLNVTKFHIEPYNFDNESLELISLPEANEFLSFGYSWQGEAVLLIYGKKLFLVKSNDYIYRESLFSMIEDTELSHLYGVYISSLGNYNFLDINDINLFFTKYDSIELPDNLMINVEPKFKNRREVMNEYFTEDIPFTYSKYLWYILFLNTPTHYIEEMIDLHDKFREDLDNLTKWIYSIYLGKEINIGFENRKTSIKLNSIIYDVNLKSRSSNEDLVIENINLEIDKLYPYYLSKLIYLSRNE